MDVNSTVQLQLGENPNSDLRRLARELYNHQNDMLQGHFGLPHPVRNTQAFIEAIREKDPAVAAQLKVVIDSQLEYARLLKQPVHGDKWRAILRDVFDSS